MKTLIEPRASCKYIIKQKETKKNTVTDDSSIENNKGPSERKHICGKGYKKVRIVRIVDICRSPFATVIVLVT